jgi:NAD+ synthase (glutamine-hydrolysing)
VLSPLSLHVGSLDLDRERALQMPVVQKREWNGAAAADEADAERRREAGASSRPARTR